MPTITRPSGLVITVPDTYTVASSERAIGRSGLSRPIVIPLSGETPVTAAEVDPLLQAMQLQDMKLFDHVDLQPTMESTAPSGIRRAGAPAIPQKQQAELAVDTMPPLRGSLQPDLHSPKPSADRKGEPALRALDGERGVLEATSGIDEFFAKPV
jgi:hypothetical protein